MKKGLNKEIIVKEAVSLVEEGGYGNLSVRELAARLSIKPSSLYNHVDGIYELELSVGEYAGEKLDSKLRSATEGKDWKRGIKDGAAAYLTFAAENRELYKALIFVPKNDGEREMSVGRKTFEVFMNILHGCGIDENNCLHFIRILRAYLHGFVELTESGYLSHGFVERRETFDFGINAFIETVDKYVKEGEKK